MKRCHWVLLGVALTVCLLISTAESQAFVINFQGRIVNDTIPDTAFAAKSSQISTLGMTFRLFDAEVGGTELWSEFWPAVQVGADGTFNVLLGSITPLSRDQFITIADAVHLEIQVSGDQAMSPRLPIVSAPSAIVGASLYSTGPGNELIDIDWLNGLSMVNAVGDTAIRLDIGAGLGSVQNLRVAGQGYFGPDDWPGVTIFGGGIVVGDTIDPTIAFDTSGTGFLGNLRIGQNGYWGPDDWPGVTILPGGIVIGGGGVDPTIAFDTMGNSSFSGDMAVLGSAGFGDSALYGWCGIGDGRIVINPPGGFDTTVFMPASGSTRFRAGIDVSPRAKFVSNGPHWVNIDTMGLFGGPIDNDTTIKVSTSGASYFAGDVGFGGVGYYGDDSTGWIRIETPHGIEIIGPGGWDTTVAITGSGVASFRNLLVGLSNSATGDFSSAFGQENTVQGDWSTVAGRNNRVYGLYSVVSGGGGSTAADSNTAAGNYSGVHGGSRNKTNGDYSGVGGGYNNVASGYGAHIGGGSNNTAFGASGTVGGGASSHASGSAGTVPGGYLNNAAGNMSFAAGYRAKANHTGSFVWSDSSLGFDFTSSATNQFSARCTGGARFVSAVNGIGTPTAGVTLASGGGSWSSISDRNAKENVAPVATGDLLERLAQVPVSTWNYKSQDPSIRHIGPMAQDFFSAFGVGEDDTHITTIDADGVALAAIQELYRITQELKARDSEVSNLRLQVERLEQLIASRVPQANQSNGGGQ